MGKPRLFVMGYKWKKALEKCPECGKEVKWVDQHRRMSPGHSLYLYGKEARVVEEKKVEEKVAEQPDLAKAIENIGGRLDKIDADVCSRFPALCAKVDRLAEDIPKRVEHGSEEWKGARKADLEHVLFSDCPDCTPVRDEVLSAKGKRLADVEAKVEEVEHKVEEPVEPETSPVPKPGFKFDYDRHIYVKPREG